MLWMGEDAIFDAIRDEPRFVVLIERLGLPSG